MEGGRKPFVPQGKGTQYIGVMQTASGLPKKSLEERKVSSKGGRSKALGGKKVQRQQQAPERPVCRGHVVQKKAKGGGEVGQRAEGGKKRCSSAFSSVFLSANLTRDL